LGFDTVIYDVVRTVGGSIAAEHGVGISRRAFLNHARSEGEVALMRALKAAMDPAATLNPGKIFAL
jgi:FAD/FMN-containing dehydrogenase